MADRLRLASAVTGGELISGPVLISTSPRAREAARIGVCQGGPCGTTQGDITCAWSGGQWEGGVGGGGVGLLLLPSQMIYVGARRGRAKVAAEAWQRLNPEINNTLAS